MKKKLLSVLLATAMVATLATGCGEAATADTGSEPAATTETKEEAPAADTSASGGQTVGIAMPTQSLERWNRDGSYLKEQFESKGYSVELTYSDNKIDQQVKDIEGLIADRNGVKKFLYYDCMVPEVKDIKTYRGKKWMVRK